MKRIRILLLLTVAALLCGGCAWHECSDETAESYLLVPSEEDFTEEDAQAMIRASEGALAPVYAPLAAQIAAHFNLAEKSGIGIDLGSGPGNLIIELCKRTGLYWVNADINPHFFPHFYAMAAEAGVGHRVSAVFADAHALPFRDNYADIVVSRGSFHFWENKRQAFAEIHRILKPGGVAYVGRGFARAMPVEVARKVRGKQGGMKYDLDETERTLRHVMRTLGITDYIIERPAPAAADGITYGIWLRFRKSGSSTGY